MPKLNALRGKGFRGRKKKRNTSSKFSRKSYKKKARDKKPQKNIANLLSATAESPSGYMREYRARKKTMQNTLLMFSLRDGNAVETLLMTAQINTDLENHPVPLTTEPSTILVRIGTDASRFQSNFEGEHPGRLGISHLSSPSSTSRKNLRLNGYLEYPHTAKALYTYKHPCLFRDSNPDPTAQQSASLTTIPDRRQLSASSVERLANQRLHLGRNEVTDWLDAQRRQSWCEFSLRLLLW
ncbi:uncharacterized protein TNCV_1288991 [Trichonephila clavipes]|nr:uncharacterized protein TNCV_1288991 [Trichonephila clavipes]